MKKEDKFGGCLSVDKEKGISVCILPSKDFGKRDIIIVTKEGAKAVRSTTELVNKLIKDYKIEHEKIVNDILPWVGEKLRDLEMEETEFGLKVMNSGIERRRIQKV